MTIMRHDPQHQHCNHSDPGRELIHVDCASHVYPDGSIGIHEMCFHVLKDEIVALCGQNGSGKSTLIEHLNGLLVPSDGDIVINGMSVARGERADLWKEVGVVFQRSEDQLFAPTVLDDVMFGPLNLGMSKEDAHDAAIKALEAVGAVDLAKKLPNYLSGGQKRLVSIAGILAMKPRIMALDEPTSDLDPVHSAMVERLILEFRERFGISVVIATHDLDLAARIADRVCLVKNGAVYAEGSPREIFYDTDLIRDAGLKQPDTVMTYLDYCHQRGVAPEDRPITRAELVTLLERLTTQ
ncbi:ATP-binding cassette domain-containing protein [Methanoregula sp.]|uniref:energy-coupling factor ABC transporter ATP-binding protein n=1 Tax=Methanoregula sp. TaxID=2052170 RepID=UPI002372BED2|nr:ATP-binding cassette domain-containing protein [Methanoregula sp.]MDD1687747.1 ATP-binding cassette domain-containing protein [Methanoregula sp.]